ncbi:expressed protein [Phakopsora pachyrhizi]|uniref:Expressed protein n=1 Tax=Phakopsora pachyrhizi TaxID=170000 RepID=A0AAV0BTA4_PHAPC|nr:expressed protein [Phakopsora pachyrhizi]
MFIKSYCFLLGLTLFLSCLSTTITGELNNMDDQILAAKFRARRSIETIKENSPIKQERKKLRNEPVNTLVAYPVRDPNCVDDDAPR